MIRVGGAKEPCTVAAHGMPGEVYMLRVWFEFFFGNGQYFQCIQPAPVFPVETARTSVGRGNEITPVFGFIGPRLPYRFHTCTMNREEQRRTRTSSRPLRGD